MYIYCFKHTLEIRKVGLHSLYMLPSKCNRKSKFRGKNEYNDRTIAK